MAGHARYTALLDANVLYPVAICDALMEVAATGIYAPKWSAEIDDEWIRNLAKDKGKPEELFHVRRDLMHEACPDWEVPEEAWRSLESGINLPDKDDRHVLAAALAGHADSIITQNLKHFPSSVLEPLGITALHPDEFLLHQLDLAPLVVLPSTAACSFKRVARSDVNVVFWDFSDRHLFTSNNEYLQTHYWVMTCPELTQMPGVHKQIYFMSGHATLKISLASNCKTAQSLQQVCGERAIYPSLAVCYQQKSKIAFQRSRSAWPKLTDSCEHLGRMFSELRQMTRLSPNSI